jgi:hypothetical protein
VAVGEEKAVVGAEVGEVEVGVVDGEAEEVGVVEVGEEKEAGEGVGVGVAKP